MGTTNLTPESLKYKMAERLFAGHKEADGFERRFNSIGIDIQDAGFSKIMDDFTSCLKMLLPVSEEMDDEWHDDLSSKTFEDFWHKYYKKEQ